MGEIRVRKRVEGEGRGRERGEGDGEEDGDKEGRETWVRVHSKPQDTLYGERSVQRNGVAKDNSFAFCQCVNVSPQQSEH